MELETEIKEFLDKFPFLSLCRYGTNEYIGIVQNVGNNIASVYVYNKLKEKDEKRLFLDLGEEWWWESNRKLPVNMFIGEKCQVFSASLRSYSMKETEVVFGPITKLSDLLNVKRLRRKTVQLIRKV